MNAPSAIGRLRSKPRLIGIIVVSVYAVLLGAAAMKILQFQTLFGSPDTMEVRAVFADGQRLAKDDPVRVDGVDVGQVDDVDLNEDGRGVTVKMKVERDKVELHRDATATVRWRLLLGGRFQVDLDPGTKPAGALPGNTIALERTESQVELEDVLTVDRDRAEAGLKQIPEELARALRDPEHPARLLQSVDASADDIAGAAKALRGTVQDADLRKLVRSTSEAATAIARQPQELRRVVEGAAAFTGTLAARDAELAATLRQAPGTMRRVTATLDDVDATLAAATPVVRRLQAPSRDIDDTLNEVRPFLGQTDRLLAKADPLLDRLRPAVRAVAGASSAAPSVLDPLQPSLDRLDEHILPYLDQIDPQTNLTTAEAIGAFAASFGDAAGAVDDNGHFIRFPATSGSTPLVGLPCTAYLGNVDLSPTEQIECRELKDAVNAYFGWNPLTARPGGRRAGGTGR